VLVTSGNVTKQDRAISISRTVPVDRQLSYSTIYKTFV